ncbi:MAG: type II secretion system F family protein [Gemmatimonadales bacterium]|nr:type II secretion system F family protein [Gemmatimonadales bacterium]
MRPFAYVAADASGTTRRGRVLAASQRAAVERLSHDGLLPIQVTEARRRGHLGGGPSSKQLAHLMRGIAGLTGVGMPLARAVESCRRLARGPLVEVLDEVSEHLRHGQTLSAALMQSGAGLSRAAQGMLEASERGSRIDQGLEQVAAALEREVELRSRLRQALAYPLLLTVVGLFSTALIVGVVIPRFATLLEDLGQAPPPITQLLLNVARLGVAHWFSLMLVLGASTAALLAYLRRPHGRLAFDGVLLRMPLVGPLIVQRASGRVAEALGGMLVAGMPLLPSFDAAVVAAGNRELQRRLEQVRRHVAAGSRLATSLEREAALDHDVLQLVALGEANGQLGPMLLRAGERALTDGEQRIKALVGLIEPLLIIAFALGVGFVAAALLQAVYALRPGMGS